MKSRWGATAGVWVALLCSATSMLLAAPEVYRPTEDLVFRGGNSQPISDAPWWQSFADPALSQVIERSLSNNGDVLSASERVEQAEALAKQARSVLIPYFYASASGSASPGEVIAEQYGFDELPEGAPPVYYTSNAVLGASYTLDLFGKNILSARAAAISAKASQGDSDQIQVVMQGQLASTYYDVVAAVERLNVVNEQLASSRDLLELVELRYDTGQVSAIDVLQQRQQLASLESQLPGAELQVELMSQLLVILMGGDPNEDFSVGVDALPELPAAPGTGSPSDLLNNRSDLVSAQHRLKAATDSRRSAALSYAPTINLGATYGVSKSTDAQAYLDAAAGLAGAAARVTAEEAGVTDGLVDMASTTQWTLSASATLPLFTGGANWGGLQNSRASERASANTYSQSVRQAVYDVESALAQEAAFNAQLVATRGVLDAAQLTFQQSQERYVKGLDTYLSVLTSLSSLQQAQLAEVQAHRSLLGARIQLHIALGGTWGTSRGQDLGAEQ